jgi:hypothetical protein
MNNNKKGELIVVGSGIKSISHFTLEAVAWIKKADIVLYCVADPVTDAWIQNNSKKCYDLYQLYEDDGDRLKTYNGMTEFMLNYVRMGKTVCAVYYGHPGIFVNPTHNAMRIAIREGYNASMLPGISSEDYLYADVGFDPSDVGCITYEATDLLLRKRYICNSSHLILWQVGCLGDLNFRRFGYHSSCISLLREYLENYYSSDHRIYHYQGSIYPICKSKVEISELGDMEELSLNGASTIYIPPQEVKYVDEDMAKKMGIELIDPVEEDVEAPEKVSSSAFISSEEAKRNQEKLERELKISKDYKKMDKNNNIAKAIFDLAENPILLREFINNNTNLVSDLTEDEISALKSENIGKIYYHLKIK